MWTTYFRHGVAAGTAASEQQGGVGWTLIGSGYRCHRQRETDPGRQDEDDEPTHHYRHEAFRGVGFGAGCYLRRVSRRDVPSSSRNSARRLASHSRIVSRRASSASRAGKTGRPDERTQGGPRLRLGGSIPRHERGRSGRRTSLRSIRLRQCFVLCGAPMSVLGSTGINGFVVSEGQPPRNSVTIRNARLPLPGWLPSCGPSI